MTLSAPLSLPEAGEPQLRRTALLLHGLAADDQAWLLQRLPAAQGARVQGLLDELRQLGIAPDPEAVDRVLAQAPAAPAAPAAPKIDVTAHAALAQASPAALAQVLRDEPAALIARLLQADAWAWKRELLPLLPAVTRQELRQLPDPLPAAPRLDAALIEAIAEQLPALPATALLPAFVAVSAPSPAGRLGRWAQRLGSRLSPAALRARQ